MSTARDKLLDLYNGELAFVRELGGEFARDFGKVAHRLDLQTFKCEDPYVERLLEGFAFLAARVRLKIDDEYATFAQSLLQIVFPHLLPPTPSMAIVRFEPRLDEGSLEESYRLERGTKLHAVMRRGDTTACQFTTASDVDLWPIALTRADYLPTPTALSSAAIPGRQGSKAAISLRFEAKGGFDFADMPIDQLRLFLSGGGAVAGRIYERLIAHGKRVVLRDAEKPASGVVLGPDTIQQVGFADDEALLPYDHRSFQGYRLLHEYFALPERFQFIDLVNLQTTLRNIASRSLEIIILLDEGDEELEGYVDASRFELFCSPAINLFEMDLDRVLLNTREPEFHVVPSKPQPIDFEVYDLQQVQGIGRNSEPMMTFEPFYKVNHQSASRKDNAYYAIRREPRLVRQSRDPAGRLGSYRGSEVFLSLVDAKEAPYPHDLRQLAIKARCTNRDLPARMTVGMGKTDFTLRSGAPVASIRAVAGPTLPRESIATDRTAWQMISQLSLNYLSIGGAGSNDPMEGARSAAALTELLSIYARCGGAGNGRDDIGIHGVKTEPMISKLPVKGPIVFGRGVKVDLTFDDTKFEGTSFFLLGAILERFLARYVSLNSFTQTTINSNERGTVIQWPVRHGLRQTL